MKQMIFGKAAFPKRQNPPKFVCAEPAQMPYEGILADRGLSPLLPTATRSGETPITSPCLRAKQPDTSSRAEYVHILLVNLSEVTLPKATVVGMAEEISPSLVAAINDDAGTADRSSDRSRQGEHTVTDQAKFRKYLHEVLGYLSSKEKEWSQF
jgi:hypothetical protein